MSRRAHQKRTALLALVLALVLTIETIAASCTVALLSDHDCQGEDCVSCHVTDMAQALLDANAAPAALPARPHAMTALAVLVALRWWLAQAAQTPVTRGDLLLI